MLVRQQKTRVRVGQAAGVADIMPGVSLSLSLAVLARPMVFMEFLNTYRRLSTSRHDGRENRILDWPILFEEVVFPSRAAQAERGQQLIGKPCDKIRHRSPQFFRTRF